MLVRKRTLRIGKPRAKLRRRIAKKLVAGKQIRTPSNPIKIIFLCNAGIDISAGQHHEFIERLKKDAKFFQVSHGGISMNKISGKVLRQADLIIVPTAFFVLPGLSNYVEPLRKIPKQKLFLYEGDEMLSSPKPHRKIIDLVLERIQKRFILRG